MKKYLVILTTIIAFTATTVYAQKDGYDWANPEPMNDLRVSISGSVSGKPTKNKVSPGHKPERFGEGNAIPAQDEDDVEEIWIPMTNQPGDTKFNEFNLWGNFWIPDNIWKKYTFAFIPLNTGKVTITIGYRTGIRTYINNDDKRLTNYVSLTFGKIEGKNVKLKGAALTGDSDLKAWNVTIDRKDKYFTKIKPVFFKGATLLDGYPGVELFSPLSQAVEVKKGQQVEITFYARSGRRFDQRP